MRLVTGQTFPAGHDIMRVLHSRGQLDLEMTGNAQISALLHQERFSPGVMGIVARRALLLGKGGVYGFLRMALGRILLVAG
jgi:hypothetical protein